MDEYRKEERPEPQWEDRAPAATTRWLVILSVVLFAAAVFAAGYAVEQNAAVGVLKQQDQAMNSAQLQMRSQIDALTAKVSELAAPPPVPATAPANSGAAAGKSAVRHGASGSASGRDPRFQQLRTQLAEQQKELKQTQDDLAAARSDLEGKLGTTRDELNGSIAKTHEELVALEKRGERLFYEFDVSKSKSFQREGPIQISLRKADRKHQSYDLMLLVDDHELSKKKVDLYEPIWLHRGDMPQPIQVVVNQIDKDRIHGYVSAPRYKESELALNAAQPATSISGSSSISSSTSPANNTSSIPTSNSATSSPGQQRPVD